LAFDERGGGASGAGAAALALLVGVGASGAGAISVISVGIGGWVDCIGIGVGSSYANSLMYSVFTNHFPPALRPLYFIVGICIGIQEINNVSSFFRCLPPLTR